MTNDIHAAAERVRRQFAGESAENVYEACAGDAYFHELPKDLHCIAEAYLALLDDTPITEEWLITQEGVTHDDDWISIWCVASDDEMKYPVFIWERAEFQQMSGPVLKSRGAVRALLLAMGVKG